MAKLYQPSESPDGMPGGMPDRMPTVEEVY
jgi:hypothetical protein